MVKSFRVSFGKINFDHTKLGLIQGSGRVGSSQKKSVNTSLNAGKSKREMFINQKRSSLGCRGHVNSSEVRIRKSKYFIRLQNK